MATKTAKTTKTTNEADAARLWWIKANRQLRDLAADLDRFAGKTGQGEEAIPFTPAQIRTMEAGISRALDAVAETVPAV
jgi:hypothetical protein